jgi:hypothetical protein
MRIAPSLLVLLTSTSLLRAAPPTKADLDKEFTSTVRPFLATYCLSCHGEDKPKGGLDLSGYASTDAVAKGLRQWERIGDYLRVGAMPPEKAKDQPTAEARKQVLAWAAAVRRYEADRTAGDPGPVAARRLSHAEYDNSVRDLTGFDLRPTKEFPVDPANEAGFDNSAESLATSPVLVKKYLDAARRVADHVVLLPDGLAFAPHPVVMDTDRDKYCVRRVIDFYQRQKTDYADYFLAAWRHRYQPKTSLAEIVAADGISAKYLATIWNVLHDDPEPFGPVAAVRLQWEALPPPDGQNLSTVRAKCERLRDFVVSVRKQLVPEVKNLTSPAVAAGSQTLIMWKNRQWVANRQRYAGGAMGVRAEGVKADSPEAKALTPPKDADEAKVYEATFERFCRVFPDAFYISERARTYADPEKEKKLTGRLLNAGFHSMTGYFRDDGPLCDLILDETAKSELDRLWLEFDCVTGAPMRQHTSFVWFERTDSTYMRDKEFDVFRAEDRDVTSEEKIRALAKVYRAKTERRGAGKVALQAIDDHFESINAAIRKTEAARSKAEPTHLTSLQALAEKAYRRPLTATEKDGVVRFYRELRDRDGMTHEEAVRDSVVGVLMSPHFCFHLVPPANGKGVEPLPNYAVASRLSYFLWAAPPDAELLAADLRKPEVLAAQAKRMLKDEKARGFATEFAGHWLDFRRFEEHNAVDRTRFPQFDNTLRSAMFEEPLRFFLDVARVDRSVLDFLYANDTFVNAPLARHYGMPAPKGSDWVRVSDADTFGRGGLLPMAVFLTQNSPGLRTSPVKRGYWVVRRLLGETVPAPPAQVPDLPDDEAKLDGLTLRDALKKHRELPSCARCHDRFDGVGVAFEGFGPVGDRRTKDLGGKPVDTRTAFPDAGEGTGVEGLKAYIRNHRQDEFVVNLCRKLLSYALGRSLIPADDLLVDEMKAKLAANGYRFGVLIETIVTSPQFRNRRGNEKP